MTLKEYKKKIDRLVKKYPNNMVIYAIDEEGNEYRPVEVEPCVLNYDEICDCAFGINAKDGDELICIN